MKINDLARVSRGEILNSPSVDSVHLGYTNPNKIKSGDFFVGNSHESISLAIENGAYAIITENSHESIDDEIALIKVKDTKNALLSILRYKFAQNTKTILVDFTTFNILKQILSSKDIYFLDDIHKDFEELFKADFSYIFTFDTTYAKTIDSKYINLPNQNLEADIIKQNPLYISFCFEDEYFEDVKIISLFFKNLLYAMHISKHYSFDTNLYKLDYFEPIEVTYIDNKFQQKEFGKSEKVFIYINDDKLYAQMIQELTSFYKWSKFIFIETKVTTAEIKSNHFIISKKKFSIIQQDFLQREDFSNEKSLFLF